MAVAFINAVAALGVVATMWVTEGLVRSRLVIVLVLLTLVAVVWTLVLQRIIARDVEQPLEAVVRAAEAIAEGDSSHRVPAGATAEFDALATSINRMTEQLLTATELRLRAEKLATTGRLAAGVSHEIGNPVAAIANYAHLLRMRAGFTPGVAEPLDALEREIGRIDRIMRGLLDYARPRRLTPKPIEVDAVIRDVVRLLADQGLTRRIEVVQALEAPAGIVYAERHDLEQVFVNLLLNAVDAMDGAGTIALRSRVVEVGQFVDGGAQRRDDPSSDRWPQRPSRRALAWLARTDRPERVLQVIIADSGPGVAPEDAERIFEPFFSTKQPGKGTGLGLAIVASALDNLGGTIWVQRAREGGAAFVILLPLHRGGLQPITPPDAPAVASS
jgi:signal transduction histidine kinase